MTYRYVENNPVKAGIVRHAEDYQWSSAYANVSGKKDNLLADDCYIVERIKDRSVYLSESKDILY